HRGQAHRSGAHRPERAGTAARLDVGHAQCVGGRGMTNFLSRDVKVAGAQMRWLAVRYLRRKVAPERVAEFLGAISEKGAPPPDEWMAKVIAYAASPKALSEAPLAASHIAY